MRIRKQKDRDERINLYYHHNFFPYISILIVFYYIGELDPWPAPPNSNLDHSIAPQGRVTSILNCCKLCMLLLHLKVMHFHIHSHISSRIYIKTGNKKKYSMKNDSSQTRSIKLCMCKVKHHMYENYLIKPHCHYKRKNSQKVKRIYIRSNYKEMDPGNQPNFISFL